MGCTLMCLARVARMVPETQWVRMSVCRRGAQMFRKVHVPLLGLVENMSCFTCPKCGHSEAIFGEGGGASTAEDLGMELLGQVGALTRAGCAMQLAS